MKVAYPVKGGYLEEYRAEVQYICHYCGKAIQPDEWYYQVSQIQGFGWCITIPICKKCWLEDVEY